MHQRLLKKRCGFLALLAGSALGCSGPEDAANTLQQRVVGGNDTGYEHGGVLYVTAEIGNVLGGPVVKIGSGSLVAPNLLMTALHVVSKNPSNIPFTCDASGNEITGSEGADLGGAVSADKVAVYAGPIPGDEPIARGARIVSTGSDTLCENDLAFVVLDSMLELPHYQIHRGEPSAVGDAVTVVGYGAPAGMDVTARTEREVTVRAVGQWIRTFTVSAGPCEGDSGGPALNEDGRIAGVFSSVASDCTSSSSAAKYTDVSYFARLVEEAFDAAGAGSPWSSGEGGQSGVGGEAGDAGEAGASASEAGATSVGGGSSAADDVGGGGGCSLGVVRPRTMSTSIVAMLLGALGLAYRRRASPAGSRRRA